MTDMTTGLPFFWTGPSPANVTPPNQALTNNLAQNTAANRANSQATSNMSAAVGANANTFDPFKQSGGFGKMTDYYSNLGAAFGRSTGGFGRKQNDWQAEIPVSHLFNMDAYKQDNPDVAASGMDPAAHWFDFGQKEGRNIQTFDPDKYLSQNQDVQASGTDPWEHWNLFGQKEGRGGAWSDFNPVTYSQHNPDVAAAGADPAAHWFEFGRNEGRQGAGDPFNPQKYSLENRDVAALGVDPYQHWTNYGYKEGRGGAFGATEAADWDKYFNIATQGGGGANTGRDALAAEYYLGNQDVFNAAKASNQDPTQFAFNHFLNFGEDEGRRIVTENSDPNFDTVGWFGAHPEKYQALFDANNQYTNPTAFAEMSNYQSPSNDYNTFQKGPSYDWQSSMRNGRNDPRVINEIYRSAGQTGLPPAVIAAVMNMESTWNPRSSMAGNFGIPQMSENMWGDNPFNGTMGGVDFNTFKNDPVGDKQIRAYTDWLIRGNKLNRDGIDVASVDDPVMQAALLQAIQFAGNSSDWRTALAGGDQNKYVTTQHPQAAALRPGGETYPTINSMYNAFDSILGGWRR